MAKYNTLQEYIDTLNENSKKMYISIRNMMFSLDKEMKERLFAGQVAFYIEKNLKNTFHESPVIILAFFKDHVNIFAKENVKFKKFLKEYKFTNKGTMQIYYDKELDTTYLPTLFWESLR